MSFYQKKASGFRILSTASTRVTGLRPRGLSEINSSGEGGWLDGRRSSPGSILLLHERRRRGRPPVQARDPPWTFGMPRSSLRWHFTLKSARTSRASAVRPWRCSASAFARTLPRSRRSPLLEVVPVVADLADQAGGLGPAGFEVALHQRLLPPEGVGLVTVGRLGQSRLQPDRRGGEVGDEGAEARHVQGRPHRAAQLRRALRIDHADHAADGAAVADGPGGLLRDQRPAHRGVGSAPAGVQAQLPPVGGVEEPLLVVVPQDGGDVLHVGLPAQRLQQRQGPAVAGSL